MSFYQNSEFPDVVDYPAIPVIETDLLPSDDQTGSTCRDRGYAVLVDDRAVCFFRRVEEAMTVYQALGLAAYLGVRQVRAAALVTETGGHNSRVYVAGPELI